MTLQWLFFSCSSLNAQNYCQDVKQLHEELQQQREFNAQLQASLSTHAVSGAHPHHEVDALRSERDRLSKEVFLLRKTLEEMEIRIETLKQTLAARDESIKKLLEMLQSKGLSTKHLEVEREEADRLRSKVVEAVSRILQLETMLDQRNRERGRLADVSCQTHFACFNCPKAKSHCSDKKNANRTHSIG